MSVIPFFSKRINGTRPFLKCSIRHNSQQRKEQVPFQVFQDRLHQQSPLLGHGNHRNPFLFISILVKKGGNKEGGGERALKIKTSRQLNWMDSVSHLDIKSSDPKGMIDQIVQSIRRKLWDVFINSGCFECPCDTCMESRWLFFFMVLIFFFFSLYHVFYLVKYRQVILFHDAINTCLTSR